MTLNVDFKMADGSSGEEIASYYDSDQFDEDSICSWFSEHDSISAITWKGWKLCSNLTSGCHNVANNKHHNIKAPPNIESLVDFCAKVVAEHLPFQAVEEYQPPVPEQIQLKIAFWSFPQSEDNIQLYTCIAHGTLDEFHLAELILKWNNVKKVIQIGFYLTGVVIDSKLKKEEQNVAVTFDRCQVVTCSCSCPASSKWCCHVIALCLHRIRCPDQVSFRAPISESLSMLKRDQLQKFTQYLINELPPKVLPTAQLLLDKLLTDPSSSINTFSGAPDPTAGAGYVEEPSWNLDADALRENIRKIIGRFCGPSPVAFVDLNPSFFASSAPTISNEWLNLLRPLLTREPEGIWNLFDIIKSLLKARDANAVEILQIITEEFLNFHQLPLWWFIASTEADCNDNGASMLQSHTSSNLTSAGYARNAVSEIFDEIVGLWQITMILPCINDSDREMLTFKLETWHQMVLEKANGGFKGREQRLPESVDNFKGFKPAIGAGKRDWKVFLSKFDIDLDLALDLNGNTFARPVPKGSSLLNKETGEEADSLFGCVYAFNTLGFTYAAISLAADLAESLLSSDAIDANRLSVAVKSAYICRVLKDAAEFRHIAFNLGLLGLAMPRKPASTKMQEIKLAHCEMNLRSALIMMSIGKGELDLIKSTAQRVQIACNTRKSQSKPFVFAIFVLEVLSCATVQSRTLTKVKNKVNENVTIGDDDRRFAYDFALQALRWTCCASDQDHPMLCECFRHFRNDLAGTLLWQYRNSKDELKEVLSMLLKLDIYIPGRFLSRAPLHRRRTIGSPDYYSQSIRISNEEYDEERKAKEPISVNDVICSKSDTSTTRPEDREEVVAFDYIISESPNSGKKYETMNMATKEEVKTEISDSGHISCDNERNITGIEILTSMRGNSRKFEREMELLNQPIKSAQLEVPGNKTECNSPLLRSNSESDDVKDKTTLRVDILQSICKDDDVLALKRNVDQKIISHLQSDYFLERNRENEERYFQSGSIDGRNTWDPAISWAENCESKLAPLGYRSDECNDFDDGTDRELFTIEFRRHVDKIRLECDSFALFELAKDILLKSHDNAEQSNTASRPRRQLHLAAFEIAVFSLRLHNLISPKWLSRTYSSHVSWIADKCIEFGCAAMRKLNENWESVLTPSEVIDISARASRVGDQLLRRAASELAVSCLPQSHALNPGEIQQAINMCKEQDIEMLERACASVETSSRNGGILPEIMFYVARQWQHIHEKLSEGSSAQLKESDATVMVTQGMERNSLNKGVSNRKEPMNVPRPTCRSMIKRKNEDEVKIRPKPFMPCTVDADRCRFDQSSPPSVIQELTSATILTAEQYVQQQMHRMAEEMLKRNYMQDRISSHNPSVDNSALFPRGYLQYVRKPYQMASIQAVRLNDDVATSNMDDCKSLKANLMGDLQHSETSAQLQNAFRVGLKAVEILASQIVDERSDIKYSQSPPCSDDIRWLCALAASLGPLYLRKFCKAVISSVSSPYVLHDLALEAARHFAMYNPAQLASYLRSPAVSPIVAKCLTMYSELVRRDLVLLTHVGYPKFVELLRRARRAFCMAPGGMTKFNELLEMIRKSCPKKGDLWQHIMNGLSRA